MKKIFVIFCCLTAIFFVVSCGSGSKTGDNTDSGETVTDEDMVDTGHSDNPDSGNPSNSDDENNDKDEQPINNNDSDDVIENNDKDEHPIETNDNDTIENNDGDPIENNDSDNNEPTENDDSDNTPGYYYVTNNFTPEDMVATKEEINNSPDEVNKKLQEKGYKDLLLIASYAIKHSVERSVLR